MFSAAALLLTEHEGSGNPVHSAVVPHARLEWRCRASPVFPMVSGRFSGFSIALPAATSAYSFHRLSFVFPRQDGGFARHLLPSSTGKWSASCSRHLLLSAAYSVSHVVPAGFEPATIQVAPELLYPLSYSPMRDREWLKRYLGHSLAHACVISVTFIV